MSQGILYHPPFAISLGEDLAEKLAIIKYEPTIPEHMTGEVTGLHGRTLSYDIEEILKYPSVLRPGESVVITEKLHGTFCGLAHWPNLGHPELIEGEFYAFSKGLGARGLVFKACAANAQNLYQTALQESLHLGMFQHLRAQFRPPVPVFVLGEVFGKGVQDISYGQTRPVFAAFDIYVGEPGHGRFLDEDEFAIAYPFSRVPVLFTGPFSDVVLANHRDGPSVAGGDRAREGIVVKSMPERSHAELGRVILKAVSATHLFRQGDQTEYQ